MNIRKHVCLYARLIWFLFKNDEDVQYGQQVVAAPMLYIGSCADLIVRIVLSYEYFLSE